MESVAVLNEQFGVDHRIQFKREQGGLVCVELWHGAASAKIYLQGAHVTSYCPVSTDEMLWLSGSTRYQLGSAIRGGIPVCWPWFGPHKDPSNRPQHGYARTSLFSPSYSHADGEDARIVLSLKRDSAPFSEWKGLLGIDVEIRLSDQLWMEVRTQNFGGESIRLSSALHNYFAVADIRQIQIPRLESCIYFDKTQAYNENQQTSPVSISGEVDRVYQFQGAELEIVDVAEPRIIGVEIWGCKNIVLWNPWYRAASQLSDFDDDGFRNMICLEPANALSDAVELRPNAVYRFGQKISKIC